MSIRNKTIALAALAAVAVSAPAAHAQTSDQVIYDDSLENGWQNYGWATLNYGSTAYVEDGAKAISVTPAAYQALYVHHTAFDSSAYTAVSFWINGGSAGGQKITLYGTLSGTQKTPVALPTLAANTWTQVTVPLSALGVDNRLTLDGFWIAEETGKAQPTFYVDDLTLIGSSTPIPTSASIFVDNNTPVRTMDARLFGLNTAVWDSELSWQSTQAAITNIGTTTLRFPGGSTSDGYDWSSGKSDGNTSRWASTFYSFAKVAEATHTQPYLTVNYGSGSPQMAAAWVAYSNGSVTNMTSIGVDGKGKDWKTVSYWATMRGQAPLAADDGYNFRRISHPAPFGFKYWEIGNECFGSWENDQHGVSGSGLSGAKHDPYTYATAASAFITKMHAIDSTIKVGVVGYPGEDSYSVTGHPAYNPNENNAVHYGWTSVVLYNLKKLNTLPNFLIHHRYAQSPTGESDDGLLLGGATGWGADATSLRQMLTDYIGAGSSSIELAATETNSVSSTPGKQSVSLVNGLFVADNLANIAQTEFNSCIWWNLHNVSETDGNMSSSLYGWRGFGDYGVLAIGDRSDTPANTPYPTYRAMELMTYWARGGDTVLSTTTDYKRLAAYGSRLSDGSLSLLVINKSATTDLVGNISLGGFTPGDTADVYQYGKPEDAAKADITHTTIATNGTSLSYTFPAYSMTVLVFAPAVPVTTPTDPTPPTPSNFTLTPVADSYVSALAADSTIHGAETQICVKREAGAASIYRRTAYLKFDLTGVTDPITAAQLSMTLNSNSVSTTGSAPLYIYGIGDTTWTDASLNWSGALADGSLTLDSLSLGTPAAFSTVNVSPGVYHWDLSSYLADKSGQIVTLQVSDPGTDANYFCFNSKEAATGKPTLAITTTPATTTTTTTTDTSPTPPDNTPYTPTTQTLPAIADSYVTALSGNTTHGSETQICVKREAGSSSIYRRIAYLKFDLTHVATPITSAQLSLTANANCVSTTGSGTVNIYGISDTAWTEAGLSWNSALTAGDLTSDSLSLGTFAAATTVNAKPGLVTWDLSSYLADKAGQVVTLQVSDPGTDANYFCFNSKEAATGQPALTIQY